VQVVDADESNVYFAVKADAQKAFKLPVKIALKQIQAPKVVIAEGNLYPFNSEGINKLLNETSGDVNMLAATSACYELKPAELIEQVRVAMLNENLAAAEDALTVLQTKNDPTAYKIAFDMYLEGMNGGLKAEGESKCSSPIKVAHSKHLHCSHTNLPVHKVFQDQLGQCLPLYRKHLQASSEGAYFLNARILLG
jgi:hypothetical protein